MVVDAEGIGMDPRFFKDPEEFLPERFVRGDTSLSAEYKNTNPFALLPFGFGVRSCVGQRFAETEIYVLTAKASGLLTHSFYFSLHSNVAAYGQFCRFYICKENFSNM